jgi:hypothetical protein
VTAFDQAFYPDVAHLRAAEQDRAHIRRLVDQVIAERRGPPTGAIVAGVLVGALAVGGVIAALTAHESDHS